MTTFSFVLSRLSLASSPPARPVRPQPRSWPDAFHLAIHHPHFALDPHVTHHPRWLGIARTRTIENRRIEWWHLRHRPFPPFRHLIAWLIRRPCRPWVARLRHFPSGRRSHPPSCLVPIFAIHSTRYFRFLLTRVLPATQLPKACSLSLSLSLCGPENKRKSTRTNKNIY